MFPEDTARISQTLENPAQNGPLTCRNLYHVRSVCTAKTTKKVIAKEAVTVAGFSLHGLISLEREVILVFLSSAIHLVVTSC